MFDTYRTGNDRAVPYAKTVNEFKAPTDDSIRLFQEMTEKAYNTIISTYSIENNELNVNAIIFKTPHNMKQVCKFNIVLNGQGILGTFELGGLNADNDMYFLRQLSEEVTKVIQAHVMQSILKQKGKR